MGIITSKSYVRGGRESSCSFESDCGADSKGKSTKLALYGSQPDVAILGVTGKPCGNSKSLVS